MSITQMVAQINDWAKRKGFYDGGPMNVGEKIALIHSELSEALEATRAQGVKMDEHVPHRTNFEVELADAVIRIFDLSGAMGINIEGAIKDKMAYNETRPYKHSKKF